jgi:hypothetical protein
MLTADLIEWVEFREIHGELVLVTTYKPQNATGEMVTAKTKSPLGEIYGGGKVGILSGGGGWD